MVAQPGLQDNDLVLWTQLLAETLNAELVDTFARRGSRRSATPTASSSSSSSRGRARSARWPSASASRRRRSPRRRVSSKRLGYVERAPSPEDARVRLLALSGRGRAAVEASRAARAALNAELVAALGTRKWRRRPKR